MSRKHTPGAVPTGEPARPLSPLERWYWICDQLSPLNVVGHTRLHGALDPDTARRALSSLQARHPLLRVAIEAEADGTRPRFRPAPDRPIPLRTVRVPADAPEPDADAHWEREVNAHELVTAVNSTAGPLARALLVTRTGVDGAPDTHDLVLTLSHVIADGTTVLTLARQWIELAAAVLAAGDAEPPAVSTLRTLPPPEGLLPAGHRGAAGLRKVIGQQLAERDLAKKLAPRRFEPTERVPFDRRVTQLLTRSITGEDLAALIEACKREQTTVHGALTAAMALAAAKDAGDEPGPFTIGSPITFREALDPVVREDEVGTYVATVPSIVDHRPGAPLWPIARSVARDLSRRRRHGEHLTSVASLGPVAPKSVAKSERFLTFMQEKGPITLCVSNVGRFDFPDEVGPWRVTRAEFVAGLSVNAYYCASITTAHDRLSWNFTHVEGAVDADRALRLADASVEALLAAVKSS
ncbi:phthiocerol/phthiodiolone dimycocerosyl transferase family protein [Streptomyces sp. BI20]|uniref:phthiocerol/phthiodiolone dimycocerosyl transferase family protein n=1 Tax=Streptomyces sp. BI20 TaxID=3403460 RepID=UPI003C79117A